MPHEQAAAIIRKQFPPAAPKPTSGIMSALGSSFRGGLGEAAEGIGEFTGLQGLAQFGQKQRELAAKSYVPTSDEEIAKADQRGFLPGLSTRATQFLEPFAQGAGSMAGRFGLPIAAGVGAAAALPEAIAAAPFVGGALEGVGLGTIGAAAATGATALADAPIEIGNLTAKRRQEGLPQDPLSDITYGLVKTAINTVSGHLLSTPLQSIIGKSAMAEARILAPKVLAGDLTSTQAAAQLSGTLRNVLQGTAENAIVGTGMMVGNTAVERAALGKDLLSPDAMSEYKQDVEGAVALSPMFGLMHGVKARGAAEDVLQKAADTRMKAISDAEAAAKKIADQDKQSPDYASKAQALYQEAQKQYDDLKAQIIKNPKAEIDKLHNDDINDKLKTLEPSLKQAAQEHFDTRQFLPAPAPEPLGTDTTKLQQQPLLPNVKPPETPEIDLFGNPIQRGAPEDVLANEQQRSLYGPDSRQAQLQQTFDMYDQTVGNRGVVNAAETLPNQNDPRQQVRMLEQLLDQYSEQTKGASYKEKIAIAARYEQAAKALEQARTDVSELPRSTEEQIAKLQKKMAVAENKGDVPLQGKLSQQLQDLESRAVPKTQQEISMPEQLEGYAGISETAEQMAARKSKELEDQRAQSQQAASAESQAYVNQRIQERRIQRKLNEANAPAAEQPQRDEELRHRAEKETIDKLVATLPTGSTVTPGQIMLGLGGEKAHLRDLQTQLAIAKLTRNKELIDALQDQIADIKSSQENAAVNKPIERMPALGEGMLPESRAKEAEAEQHADRQSELLQAFVAQLQKIKLRPDTAEAAARLQEINKKRKAAGKPAITLADQSATLLDTARMAYLKSHLDEIEARRAAFGLPPMADWEIGEARARVMEGFNELQDRWGQAVPKNAPVGQRQFGAPTAAVAALQDQMRTNIYQNVSSAAERMLKNTQGTMKEKTVQRSAIPTFERDENGQLRQTGYARPTGPQPVTPNLNLREQPKLAGDDKQHTLDMIDHVLNTLETRTTAKPTETVKPPAKVKSLSDIAQLLAEEKSGTTTAKTDAASVELLHQLRDALENTSDKEFIALAREQVQRVMEGNLPDQFAVRELGDMIRAQEEGRQSATRPGATQEELQRTSAQPQRSLFPEGEPITQRATPENFQKMLDSKNVQGMREAIAQQKADNQAALQAVKDSIQPAKTAAQQAEAALNRAKEKAAPLLASAEKERGAPEWYAPAVRKVVELETALQSIPPRIKLLKDIREKIAGLNKDQKNTLLGQVQNELYALDKSKEGGNANVIKQLLELKQALLSKEPLSKEISRLSAAVRLARSTIDKARADLNKLVEQHVADTTVREALLAEADKATAKIEKLTKAFEEAQRGEATEQTKPAEEKPVNDATPMAEWRAALQRGREGMDLPGTRVLRDTAAIRERVIGIRRKLGSFDAQLEDLMDPKRKLVEGDKEKIDELKKKRSDAVDELSSVYENSPRITTEIKEQGQLDLEKAFDEAQAAGYDLIARKRREKAGELPPELPAAKKGNTVVHVRTGRVSESGVRDTPAARAKIAERALRQLAITRAELKALQDRMQYLRDNNKAKNGNRYTDLFKDLQAQEAKLKETVAQKQTVVAEVTKSQKETNAAVASARKSVEEAQSGKEALALKEAEEQRQAEAAPPAVFRTTTRKGASLREQKIAKIAEEAVAGWERVPEIEVVENEAGLPQHLQEQARQARAEYERTRTNPDDRFGFPGVYDPQTGKVFLVAEHLYDANDVALTIAHEVAGHFGLREMLGKDYRTVMDRLYEGNEKVKAGADAKMAANSKLTRQIAVEEVLADIAEKGPSQDKGIMGALRTIYYAVKKALARLSGSKNVSDFEVNQIVANARRYVKKGTGGRGGSAETGEAVNRVTKYSPELKEAGDLAEKIVATDRPLRESLSPKALQLGALELETKGVDQFAPVMQHKKQMEELAGNQMAYYLRMSAQRLNLLGEAVGRGFPQLKKFTRADGREERLYETSDNQASLDKVAGILKDANKLTGSPDASVNLFSLYEIAKRAEDVGLNKLDYSGTVTQEMLDKAMQRIKAVPGLTDVFDRAKDMYHEYNKDGIRFAMSNGAISKELGAKMLANKDYVPYYREGKDGAVSLMMGNEEITKVGNVKDQPYLHELVGGDKRILNFLESSVQNSNMLLEMGLRNRATWTTAHELQEIGLAKIKPGTGPAANNTIRFKVNGEDFHAIVEDTPEVPAELLVKGMAGIPVQTSALLRMVGAPSRLIRAAFVANPISAGRILFKDTISSAMVGGSGFDGVRAALKNVGDNLMERRGISGGEVYTGTQADLANILRKVQAGGPQWTQWLAKANSLHAKADAMTRQIRYESYRKQGLSEMQSTLQALESMNFTRHGISPSLHVLNAINPFLNSQIQGVNTLVKALRGNMPFNEKLKIQQKIMQRGMMMAGATMLYTALMQDNDTYKNATPEQKYNNWFTPFPGMDEMVRVSIPFEAGILFKAVPEAFMNFMYGHDKEAATAMRMLTQKMIPGGDTDYVPQILKPTIEAYFNKSFYTGRDIESRHEQGLLPEERVRDSTTELAAQLGSTFGVSPVMVDHLISGYTGMMGLAVAKMASSMVFGERNPNMPEPHVSQMPIIGSMFQPQDASNIMEHAYEAMTHAQQVHNTYNDLLTKKHNPEAAQEFLDKNATEFAKAQLSPSFTKEMHSFQTMLQYIATDPTLSRQEKMEKIDEVKKQRTEASQRYLDTMGR
jgi:hypothetical protein